MITRQTQHESSMRGGALFAIVLIVCVALAVGAGLLILSMVYGGDSKVADAGLPAVPPGISSTYVKGLMDQYFKVKSNCREVMHATRVQVANELVALDGVLATLGTSLADQVKATKAKDESLARRKAIMQSAVLACKGGDWMENPPESILF